MAKKLVAVTEIRHNEEITPAGETLDASKFDKKQLEALYDAGAVRIEEVSEEKNEEKNEEPKVETSPAPTKAAPAPVKAAQAAKESADAKDRSK